MLLVGRHRAPELLRFFPERLYRLGHIEVAVLAKDEGLTVGLGTWPSDLTGQIDQCGPPEKCDLPLRRALLDGKRPRESAVSGLSRGSGGLAEMARNAARRMPTHCRERLGSGKDGSKRDQGRNSKPLIYLKNQP